MEFDEIIDLFDASDKNKIKKLEQYYGCFNISDDYIQYYKRILPHRTIWPFTGGIVEYNLYVKEGITVDSEYIKKLTYLYAFDIKITPIFENCYYIFCKVD